MHTPLRPEWRDRLDRFPRATPDLIQRRELLRRTDSKFVLTPQEALALVASLSHSYAVLPAGDELLAEYCTLYFDTAALDLYHQHRRGRRVRHKVRIRHYPDRCLTRLEVKTRRSALETSKSWRERAFGDEGLTSDDHAFIAQHTRLPTEVLPQAWTYFRRVTLLGLDTDERVTLDLGLRLGRRERSRNLDDLVIVEVKQWPFRRGTPVMDALRRGGWQPVSASKYCSAIASSRPELPAQGTLLGLRALERGAA